MLYNSMSIDSQSIVRSVDGDRLQADIETNASFGSIPVDKGEGRTVLTGTPANRAAREYLIERMTDAGLEIRIDPVGNIAGRYDPTTSQSSRAPVATGSHLDSVPEGGIFDGVLGVYGALEAVRALQDAEIDLERPVEVVCFTEEEGGRFADGVLGSSVACRKRSVESALALKDEDGTTLEDALTAIDASGTDQIDARSWDSWLELHVEQGERLESAGKAAGIVTAITGTVRCSIEITGEANHSGSTAMNDRTDALAAASELVLTVEATSEELVEHTSESLVGTVGSLSLSPNAVNVVPGTVTLGLDVRDVQTETIETVIDRVRTTLDRLEAERGVETEFERPYNIDPIEMDDRCQNALSAAAAAGDIDTLKLHSGAGHDTMHVGTVTDAGMIFAPSRDGISHSPREWTDWSDATATTRVLTGGIARLAGGLSE